MKLHNILSALTGAALLFGTAACTSDVEYVPAEKVAGEGVYLGDDIDTPVDIAQNATEVTVPVYRTNPEGTYTVGIESTLVDSKGAAVQNVFAVPSQVTFADGALEAPLTIAVDFAKVTPLENYTLSLKVKGGDLTPYGLSARDYILVYAPWDDYKRYGGKDEYALVTLSAFGFSDREVAVYKSESLVSDQERYQFGDYECPELNDDDNTWTSYVNGYNFTVTCAANPVSAKNPDIYLCSLTPAPTGDTESFGSMLMITDVATYRKNGGNIFPGNTIEELEGVSYLNKKTGLFTIYCVYYTADEPITAAREYMQLPGFKSYGLEFTYTGNYVDIKGNESATIEAYRTDDVASFSYNLLPGALTDEQIKTAVSELKNNTEAELVYEQQTNLSFKLTDEGAYTIVAVGYDDAGEAVCDQSYTFNFKSVQKATEWESIGYCQYTDGLIYGFDLVFQGETEPIGGETWPVEVQKHKTTQGRYRLVNPYYSWPVNVQLDHAWSLAGDYYIVFNTANPAQVYIEESELGLELNGLNWGPLSISSLAFQALEDGYAANVIAGAGYFGTNDNGVITFPGWSLLCGRIGNGKFGWYYADGDPSMEFPGAENVPTGTGLTTIDLSSLTPSAAPAKAPAKAVSSTGLQATGDSHFHGSRQVRATKIDGKTLMKYRAANPGSMVMAQ